MMLLLRPLIIAIAFTVFFGVPLNASACTCASEEAPCEALSGASVIFTGKVIGAAQQNEIVNKDGSKTTYDVGSIRFLVQEVFVGPKEREMVIHSGTGGGDCGYWFRRGEIYLVYAYGDLSKLSTNICTRTRPIAKAEEDLAFLRHLPPKGIGGRVYGLVQGVGPYPADQTEKDGIPLAGIVVSVEGKKQYTAITGRDGRYELVVEPGEYRVRASLPDYYSKEIIVRDFVVSDRGCVREDFFGAPNGRISGRVLDPDGRPLPNVNVVLIDADIKDADNPRSGSRDDWADGEGRFNFTEIPPGRYLLGLNLNSSPDSKEPYPPTYYPGVTDQAQAVVITLRLGEKLSGYDLQLVSRLTEHRVEGVVVWPDGKPVAGAEVYLMDHRYPGWIANGQVKTDGEGRFALTGFEGLTYWVQASADKRPEAPYGERQPMHAEPPTVKLIEDVSGVRLVLVSEGSTCNHYRSSGK